MSVDRVTNKNCAESIIANIEDRKAMKFSPSGELLKNRTFPIIGRNRKLSNIEADAAPIFQNSMQKPKK